MADSLEDLGTTAIWQPESIINWATDPTVDFGLSRKVTRYPGSAQEFTLISEDNPRKWEFEVSLFSKQAEYDFLNDFIYTFQAMKKRFWFPLPVGLFQLHSFVSANNTMLTIKENGFDYKGWERFYMRLTNGDQISRHITAIQRFPLTKTIDLTVSAMPNYDIYPEDVEFFSFLPLCRFDQNAIKQKFSNNVNSKFTLKLQELLEHDQA